MNFKELFVQIGLLFLIIYAFNTFFFSKTPDESTGPKSGQSFVAPQSHQEAVPLQKDVHFMQVQTEQEPIITAFETPYAEFKFSSRGAVLEQLAFKKDGQSTRLVTIGSQELADQEKAFMVALGSDTPLYYVAGQLIEDQDSFRMIYSAESAQAQIKKTFMVSKVQQKVDVMLEIVPRAGLSVQARILFPSPYLKTIGKDEVVSALVYNEKNALQKIARKSLDVKQGWIAPTLFGSENKYFIHAMVNDAQSFVRRAYYNATCATVVSILEGPIVTTASSWTLSFYVGQKTEKAVAAVDSRLEKAVEYSGWLAPLARMMLFLLSFFYAYFLNYGLAIIIITALIKGVTFPIVARSRNAMKKQTELSKKLAYIKQKYHDDPERLAQERAELIKKYGVPGISSLLPILLQIVMMYSLSTVLSTSVDLYLAPFLWVSNLSATDPYYILPLIIALVMTFNALLAPAAQRLTLLAMALVFGAFGVNLSAGVSLYLATNALVDGLLSFITKK